MPEINSLPHMRPIHQSSHYIWDLREKGPNQLLARVLILKFQQQVSLNDPVHLIVPGVFEGSQHAFVPTRKRACCHTCTAVANGESHRNTNAQLRILVQAHSAQQVSSLISPIIANIPCWHLLHRMDLQSLRITSVIDIAIRDPSGQSFQRARRQ